MFLNPVATLKKALKKCCSISGALLNSSPVEASGWFYICAFKMPFSQQRGCGSEQ